MAAIAALTALLGAQGLSQGWAMAGRPITGIPAPEFQLPDLDGQVHPLAQYRGRIVLINFWATWCKPCTTEMPAMQAAYDRLRDHGLVVVAIKEAELSGELRLHSDGLAVPFPRSAAAIY